MISLTFYKFLRPFLHNAGEKNQIILSKVIKTLNETFGSIKELRILNKEKKIKDNFSSDIYVYNKNFFYFSIIQRLPKIILEIFFLATLMLTTIYFLNQNQNFLSIVPELALYTLISLRFIPAFNSMSSNFTYLKIGEASIRIIFNDLKKLNEKSNTKRNLFESSKKKLSQLKSYIYLENLSYKYPNKNLISLKDINGEIDKGENVVITGTTGSGKTTLVNLMLGFLKPQSGNIYFTGKSIFEFSNRWIEQVSYVSQSCYLMDRSIMDNITFNFSNEKIDRKKLEKSLLLSNLDEFIKSLPDRESTKVGNDGVKLSGGERQRIALARAIYKNSNIIFMDEFSSALDARTEEYIFKNLIEEFKDKTIITISHRENIIKKCDKKFILNQGTLKIL